MNSVLRGSLAGLAATAPMSLAMRAGEKFIPVHDKGHLPPRRVTENLLSKLGLRKFLPREHRETAALLAHYGFGAAAGALFGVTAARTTSIPKPVSGAAVGVLVWAASYLAGLPAAGLHANMADEPLERSVQMIGAHLVWGAVAGALLEAMSSSTKS
jgi:uncharacterized membrane protein YagU involved in acid resistance